MAGRAPPETSSPGGATARGPLDPRTILSSLGTVVYDWDIASDVIHWGVTAGEVLAGTDLSVLTTGTALSQATEPGSGTTRQEAIFAPGAKDQGSGVPYRTRYAVRLGPDRLLAVEDAGRWYADAHGRPAFAHGVVRIARGGTDADTLGTRDRSEFLADLRAEVAETHRGKRTMSLLVASIEGLGDLGATLGPEAVDGIVDEVSRRLHGILRRKDRLVRYADNRFGIALLSCALAETDKAMDRLAALVAAEPVVTGQGVAPVSLRIGAAVAPDHASDAPTLLRRAEEALAAAEEGDAPCVVYGPDLKRPAARRSRGPEAIDVIEALNSRRVQFARQPILEARCRTPAFAEALVRMRTGDGRIVTAGEMIPVVERAGLVPLVDARMLELTADYLAAHPDERLSINLSPLTLHEPDWLGTLAAHLGARPGIAPRLIVEIKEADAVRDARGTRARLDAMKALGVAVAIDHFGAGHASFKHLHSFPIDIVKIDGAFVQNLAGSGDDRFFVRALVDLAHRLNIATVAEWVADEDTARLLADWGIDYLQGDYCGQPVLAQESVGRGIAAVA